MWWYKDIFMMETTHGKMETMAMQASRYFEE
jgi:hypothetical protein